jgi:DNA primase
MMPAMQFPPDVQAIVIGADNDPQGRAGAQKAAHAYAERGLSVRIIYPLDGFKDFNEELQGATHAY